MGILSHTGLPIAASLAVLVGFSAQVGGDLSVARHMGMHIVLMSIVAPCIAMLVGTPWTGRALGRRHVLAVATAAQLAVLWAAHTPHLHAAAMQSRGTAMLLQVLLLIAAVGFWLAVRHGSESGQWRVILALLLTGKLVCLLAVLLVFAPRPLYGFAHAHAGAGGGLLFDQQLAGLVMIVACPLTYVGAAILIAARWLRRMERADTAGLLRRSDA